MNKLTIDMLRKAYLAFRAEDNRQYKIHEEQDCGTEFVICTNGARWLQQHFFPEGVVMGYSIDDNPTATIGVNEEGHDFLVVNDTIIDFWPRTVPYDRTVPIAQAVETAQGYGNVSKWEVVEPSLVHSYTSTKMKEQIIKILNENLVAWMDNGSKYRREEPEVAPYSIDLAAEEIMKLLKP